MTNNTVVTLKSTGEEVDITQTLKEFDKMNRIIIEIGGQITNLLATHEIAMYKALKGQGNELAVSFAVKIRARAQSADVNTDITYTVEKVKDGIDGHVEFKQEELPGLL